MKISVVIPVYDMENYKFFLWRCIHSVFYQHYDDFEIIISDNSPKHNIYHDCEDVDNSKIIHIICNKEGSAANTNNAISYSTGDIIKPLFMDDYLRTPDCFNDLIKNYKDDKWFAYSRVQVREEVESNVINPYWNDDIIKGRNTISCPSVIAFPNDDNFFDENLNWMMDCEFYHRLYLKYKEPEILNDSIIAIQEGDHQVTNKLSKTEKEKDLRYVKEKYDII